MTIRVDKLTNQPIKMDKNNNCLAWKRKPEKDDWANMKHPLFHHQNAEPARK